MAEKKQADEIAHEELNLLTKKPELKQKAHGKNLNSFAVRLIISVLLLIWLSFSAVPHLLELSGRKAPIRTTAEHNVLFEDIVPSEKLEWHQCYDTFYCARLTVPMDYRRPLTVSKNNPKVHIALTLKPGRNSTPNNFSISPLLTNPGGPGGSGVSFILLAGGLLQNIVDPDLDIIGFDPRGIGATTPRADCFAYPFDPSNSRSDSYTDEDYIGGNFHRIIWESSGSQLGMVNESADGLLKWDARGRTVARLCEDKDGLGGKDSVLKFVDTSSVARDMISIIDAWDEWRDGLESQHPPCQKSKTTKPIVETETSALDTKGKLVYWGFSYGTLLGATFAALFPDRVGRVVLDGVVDADLYASPMWSESLLDTDTIYDSFSTYCFQAGSQCALYQPGDSSASIIAQRFESILSKIKANPLTLINHQTNTPVLVTYDMLKNIIFLFLYGPSWAFPILAVIANLLYHDQTEILGTIFGMPALEPVCAPSLPAYEFRNEAFYAVMCGDKRYPLNESLPELQTRFEHLANISSFADIWMTLMLFCSTWSISPSGPPLPWDDQPLHIPAPINTSFPLLFLSNTYDPVTPLAAGLKMSRKFTNSGLIEQRSEGHCSIAAVSLCTIGKLRAYFGKGLVPAHPVMGDGENGEGGKWEKCETDQWPWHPFDAGAYVAEESGVEMEAVEAVKDLQDVFGTMSFFGLGDERGLNLAGVVRAVREML